MMKICLVIFLILAAVLKANNSEFFLGERHEYGHIPIDKSQPQYALFYWLFKSRSQMSNPPLVIWMEGGPGCSCQQALFLENGPYRLIKGSSNFTSNPFAWNNQADVLSTDNPIGTGLSTCNNISRIPRNGDEAAADFYGFLMNFFSSHPEYDPKITTVYFTGHSYAGHFIPSIVTYFLKKNFPFKIGGVLLGNPYSNPHALAWSYPTYAYQNNLISYFTYFAGMVSSKLYEFFDYIGWQRGAYLFFKLARSIVAGLFTSRFNQADIRGVSMPINHFENLMNSKLLKEINMESRNWANCNPIIANERMDVDHITDYTHYLEEMLNKNITIMFYYGTSDFVCSTSSWDYMSEKMKWRGAEGFKNTEEHLWKTNGKVKGVYKNYENLWYIQVYNAGHIVFYTEHEFGYDLITRLIKLTSNK